MCATAQNVNISGQLWSLMLKHRHSRRILRRTTAVHPFHDLPAGEYRQPWERMIDRVFPCFHREVAVGECIHCIASRYSFPIRWLGDSIPPPLVFHLPEISKFRSELQVASDRDRFALLSTKHASTVARRHVRIFCPSGPEDAL